MKKYFLIFIIFLIFNCFFKKNIPLSEIPMYDGDNITKYQDKINKQFINDVLSEINKNSSELKSLNDASDYFVKKGWEFFNNNDYSTGIKRFNQAWLLNPKNPDVFWGFGVYMGIKYKFDESIQMLDKSLELNSQNVLVMEDLAKSYNMNGLFNIKLGNEEKKSNFTNAIKVIEDAIKLKETGHLYHHWAVSLFYLEKYIEAKEKINRAIELGENIPKKFINDINKKLNLTY